MEGPTKTLLIAILAVCIIAANNIFFYQILRTALDKNHEREVASVASQIQNSIEQSRLGAKLYEDMIGKMLRASAVAAKHALPSHIGEVSQEQLERLKQELMLRDLSLMIRTSDDIVVQQSTDPKEIGLSTKGWGNWYTAFTDLFLYRNTKLDWGQKLPQFWSGPYEIASSDTKSVSKWGYFFDGTADYMIDPYIDDAEYRNYQKTTGTEAIINSFIHQNPSLLEVTGINPATFGKKEATKFEIPSGELFPLIYKPYFFGTYRYGNKEEDAQYVALAASTETTQTYRSTINGMDIMKTFIPIKTDMLEGAFGHEAGAVIPLDRYVLCIVSDHKRIQSNLDSQFATLITIVLLGSALLVGLLLIVIRLIGKAQDKAVRATSETYAEEVNRMFLNIRGQRHDFLNHVNVIHSYVETGKMDELKAYTTSLIGDIGVMNDIIKIGQPQIAAILQAKMVSAMNKKIAFNYDFAYIHLAMSGALAVNMVRVIGNLLDNAFEAVEKLPKGSPWVECKCWVEGRTFHFSVVNAIAEEVDASQIPLWFTAGHTTKREHSGLGLAIVKQIADQYRGDIRVEALRDRIKVHVMIPVKEGAL